MCFIIRLIETRCGRVAAIFANGEQRNLACRLQRHPFELLIGQRSMGSLRIMPSFGHVYLLPSLILAFFPVPPQGQDPRVRICHNLYIRIEGYSNEGTSAR
jgi:hypothetical protein